MLLITNSYGNNDSRIYNAREIVLVSSMFFLNSD